MTLDMSRAQEIIEAVFTFDNVGDTMMAVRKTPDSKEAQANLMKDLLQAAISEAGNESNETIEVLKKAAEERVQQFVTGSKSASSGCGGVK